jgi:hypothetical protein
LPDGGHLYFGHMEEVTSEILRFMHDHLDKMKRTTDGSISRD